MTYLLVSGGFDLSVGSVLALSSTICAYLLALGWGIPEAILATLVMGGAVGAINGLLVTSLNINPLIATLGTMSAGRGLALVLTEGFSLSNLPKSFGLAGNANVLGMPVIVWIMMALVIIGDIGLRKAAFFRQIYFVGSNEQAARLSGIDVTLVRLVAYGLSGLLAAVDAIVHFAVLNPLPDSTWEEAAYSFDMTASLLLQTRDAGLRRFVFASSNHA
jgi:ribose transport system permease protein